MWKNNWYYLQKDGSMLASSWLQWNGSWYFLGKDGAMFVGKHQVPVMFDSSGRFIGNWPK
jgi:glucan-binding YG repeat protein